MANHPALDPRPAGQWAGTDLGTRTVSYDQRDAIIYALAVGAGAEDLDLVFEERLRVLPTFALALAQWAPDALGSQGGFDTRLSVHGSQRLKVTAPLPRSGEITMRAKVANVWDKGSAAVFDIDVESDYFVATWSIFGPGSGGFGGERGPGREPGPEGAPDLTVSVPTFATQAALYRLTGDRHHIHIDPEAAAAIDQPRPILHGLCTMAAATLPLAAKLGAHPADLTSLAGRFAAPVFPGDTLELSAWRAGDGHAVELAGPTGPVITGGHLSFA